MSTRSADFSNFFVKLRYRLPLRVSLQDPPLDFVLTKPVNNSPIATASINYYHHVLQLWTGIGVHQEGHGLRLDDRATVSPSDWTRHFKFRHWILTRRTGFKPASRTPLAERTHYHLLLPIMVVRKFCKAFYSSPRFYGLDHGTTRPHFAV